MTGGTGVVPIDGTRIAYRRAGTEGPPVVLLHGGGIDDARVSWRHVLADLEDTHQVYAPNWPGYGASDDGIDHSIETYIDIVERFIERLGLESITLAGISMGGGAALGYALAHPERVDRLALVDSYGLGPRIPGGRIWKAAALVPGSNAMSFAAMGVSRAATRAGLGMVVADERRLEESFITDVRQRAQQPSVGRAFEDFQRNEIAMSGRARTNYAEELPDLEMPTLLVHGQEDPLFPAQWSAAAAQLIPDAELHLLERCGHWPTRERPARFGRIFRGFLEGS